MQIAYEAACVSNTIKNMLSSQGQFTETELREIKFPEITTPILERVCQYFYYKLRYTNWCARAPAHPHRALNPDASVWELYRDVRTLGLELSASHIARNLHVPWSLHADDARPSRGLFCC